MRLRWVMAELFTAKYALVWVCGLALALYFPVRNLIFLAVTGFIAVHGIRYRDAEGNTDVVRLLFGSIAAVFFFMVLIQDVLGLMRFG